MSGPEHYPHQLSTSGDEWSPIILSDGDAYYQERAAESTSSSSHATGRINRRRGHVTVGISPEVFDAVDALLAATKGMFSAAMPPIRETNEYSDEEPSEHIARVLALTPEETVAVQSDLDATAQRLRLFAFDDPRQQAEIDESLAFMRWNLFGKPGDELPKSAYYDDLSNQSIAIKNNHSITKVFSDAVSQHTSRIQALAGGLEVRHAVTRSIMDSPGFTFLRSFGDSITTTREQPLTDEQKMIERSKILGDLMVRYHTNVRDIYRPHESTADQAPRASREYWRAVFSLDEQTRMSQHTTQPTMQQATDRLRTYVISQLDAEQLQQILPNGVFNTGYWDISTRLRSVLETICGNEHNGPDKKFVSKVLYEVLSGNCSGTSFHAYLADRAAYTTALIPLENSLGREASPVELEHFIWLARTPASVDSLKESTSHGETTAKTSRTSASADRMRLLTKETLENGAVPVGEILIDHSISEPLSEGTCRMLTGVPSTLEAATARKDTPVAMRVHVSNDAYDEFVGASNQPYVLGYALIEHQYNDAGHTIDFALDDKDMLQPCLDQLDKYQKIVLIDDLKQRGLTVLAHELTTLQDMTFEDLRAAMAEHNVYYLPDSVNPKDPLLFVKEGRAHLQCQGSALLYNELVNRLKSRSARLITGLPLPSGAGEIIGIGHVASLQLSRDKAYVVDAQPEPSLLRRQANTPRAKAAAEQQADTANEDAAPDKPLETETAADATVGKSDSSQPHTTNNETSPEELARRHITIAAAKLIQTRNSFEAAARLPLGIENDKRFLNVELLYQKILTDTTPSDPLRKVWEHLAFAVPHTREGHDYAVSAQELSSDQLLAYIAEAEQTITYLTNIQKLTNPAERMALGTTTADATLQSFVRLLITAKKSYEALAKARGTLESIAPTS